MMGSGRLSRSSGTLRPSSSGTSSTCFRKMQAESLKKPGRTSLWSPSKRTMFLSPAYASKICCEWCGRTRISASPQPNSAGTKHVFAASTGRSLYRSKFARFLTEPATKLRAVLTRNGGTFGAPGTVSGALLTSSSATCSSDANGESSTRPAIDASRLACSTALTEPIERPQRAIDVTRPVPRRCSRTRATSSFSCHPSEMYSPVDRPHPAKSNEKTFAPVANTTARICSASARQDALPCW
mmetsp:Transcript_27250/g.69272  ORF Transcript_27250/g.69272 Transcript_27250/m.69272 type:complete len:241 (+) Transcript_27250:697-1419(+)